LPVERIDTGERGMSKRRPHGSRLLQTAVILTILRI
jgi:hypothetical protein